MFSKKLLIDKDTQEWVFESTKFVIDNFRQTLSLDTIIPSKLLKSNVIRNNNEFDKIVDFMLNQFSINYKFDFFTMNDNAIHNQMISRPGFAGFSESEPAGLYCDDNGKLSIGIKEDMFLNSMRLVAVLAHELSHYKLLHELNLADNDEDLTDLLTVFFGFGIFNSSVCVIYTKFQDENAYGWSVSKTGYLNEHIFGYIIYIYETLKNSDKRKILKELKTNVEHSFKLAESYHKKNKLPIFI